MMDNVGIVAKLASKPSGYVRASDVLPGDSKIIANIPDTCVDTAIQLDTALHNALDADSFGPLNDALSGLSKDLSQLVATQRQVDAHARLEIGPHQAGASRTQPANAYANANPRPATRPAVQKAVPVPAAGTPQGRPAIPPTVTSASTTADGQLGGSPAARVRRALTAAAAHPLAASNMARLQREMLRAADHLDRRATELRPKKVREADLPVVTSKAQRAGWGRRHSKILLTEGFGAM